MILLERTINKLDFSIVTEKKSL